MVADWTMITLVIGFFAWCLAYFVIMPLANAYMQYKMQIKDWEITNKNFDWDKDKEIQKNIREKLEEGLQGNNDDPDIKQRSGKSDQRTPIHDEELPF